MCQRSESGAGTHREPGCATVRARGIVPRDSCAKRIVCQEDRVPRGSCAKRFVCQEDRSRSRSADDPQREEGDQEDDWR